MPALVSEWLNLLLRWTHVVAAILWVGDSFLFMWMDASLEPPSRKREGDVAGELWMVHSGGFYEVVKRRVLAPGEVPARLHWFKWQAYTTWLSGAGLLAVVYWLGGAAYLVDPSVARLGAPAAVALSAALPLAGWLLYDALWSRAGNRPRLAQAGSIVLLGGSIAAVTLLFAGRAAFLEFGALLGTTMAANVFRRIIPAQDAMIAATRAGRAADPAPGARAKQRSIHNHVLTFPVVFCMLSNHFPSLYAHRWNGVVLGLFVVLGAAVKLAMNARGRDFRAAGAAGVAFLALAGLTAWPAPAPPGGAPVVGVTFGSVRGVLERRCTACHSAHPTNPSFPEAPAGVRFDDPARIAPLSQRILVRAVLTRTMPLGNLTGMTDAERDTLAAWIADGARPD